MQSEGGDPNPAARESLVKVCCVIPNVMHMDCACGVNGNMDCACGVNGLHVR